MSLTPRQIQILRWLEENPSNQASWTIEGRELRRKESVKDASHMKVSGPLGSILIAAEDNAALRGFIVGCPTRDKIYGPSDAGKQALGRNSDDRVPDGDKGIGA